jgi:tetratricopeptide (TPR) repeat protein
VELRNLDSVLKGITPHKRVDYSLLETKTDLNMAESALNKVIDKAPPQLRIVACYYLASVKIERGQVREAQGILKKILELNPNLYFRHLTQQKIKITDALLERSN